jgi:hypothetical protein
VRRAEKWGKVDQVCRHQAGMILPALGIVSVSVVFVNRNELPVE